MDLADGDRYPSMQWPTSLDIPLKASEEVVSIDLETDLPDDPTDLKTLLIEESSDKEHWLTIAIAYCNQGRLEEGIKLANMALDVFENLDRSPIYTFLTWAYLKLAKNARTDPAKRAESYSKVEQHLTEAIGYSPTWIGNMLATIDLYYQRGHYDKALETSDIFIKNIVAEDRRNGVTTKPNCLFLLLRAKILYQRKNYVASLRLFQELLVSNPSLKPDPRIGIGLCFWQLKDNDMAIKAWQRALELDPSNVSASILVLLGKFHKSFSSSENDDKFKKSYSDALKDFNNIYGSNKENPVLLVLLQSYFYYKGDYAKVQDIYQKKIEPLSSVTTSTVLSDAMFWCARAYYALDDYKSAFTMFQKSLKLNEDNLLAKLGFGQTQYKNNLLEESILTFESIHKASENIQEVNYILGLLYASKCLDPASFNSLANNEKKQLLDKSIQFLDKYIKLTTSKKNHTVTPRAYLVISRLYEIQNQHKQSLEYISKAVEQMTFIGQENIPLEVLNNMGSFYFINGDLESAEKYFNMAKDKLATKADEALQITVDFNVARTLEEKDSAEARKIYEKILSDHPDHIHARIRSLLAQYFQSTNENNIEGKIIELYNEHNSDMEVRSFYSWFLKSNIRRNHGRDEKAQTEEISHNRETLTKYDSHDIYALVSLGNVYCALAHESKKNPEKAKQSFLKGVQLFQKALQLDPWNIFAAQGVAIVFAENKRFGASLEVLRKVRDSIDNEDVHLNLATCFLEIHEYAKAIEEFEFARKKFSATINEARVLNLLGRAWYSRGLKENSLICFKKSLESIQTALVLEEAKPVDSSERRKVSTYKFNVALLHFQIAETLRRSESKSRTVQDIVDAMAGLESGLAMLKELKELKVKFIPEEELEQRIQLGETTMRSALKRCKAEQEEFDLEQSKKLEEARKTLQENELEKQKQIEKEEEIKQQKLLKQKEEYQRLQEEAQRLIQERESAMGENEEVEDGDEENEGDKDNKGKKKRKKSIKKPSERKRRKGTKKTTALSDDDDEEATVTESTRKGKKKSALSEEFIEDSDEAEMSDASSTKENDVDGLF